MCSVAGQNIFIKNNIPYLQNGTYFNTFVRKDGSSFLIIPTSKTNNYIREYIYLVYLPEKDMVKATRIYSEMDLLVNDAELRDRISNYLLSENRVAKKINGFNGYVGYVEKGSMINYYNPNIESSLNIQR